MSAPTKTAPAKTTAAPAKAAPAKAAQAPAKASFDFSAVQATNTEMPKRTRDGKLAGTPFLGWMKESRAERTAKGITVPASAEKDAVYLIRAAARAINSGVAIISEKGDNDTVTITFRAQDQKAVQPRQKKGETDEAFRARVSQWEAKTGKTFVAKAVVKTGGNS